MWHAGEIPHSAIMECLDCLGARHAACIAALVAHALCDYTASQQLHHPARVRAQGKLLPWPLGAALQVSVSAHSCPAQGRPQPPRGWDWRAAQTARQGRMREAAAAGAHQCRHHHWHRGHDLCERLDKAGAVHRRVRQQPRVQLPCSGEAAALAGWLSAAGADLGTAFAEVLGWSAPRQVLPLKLSGGSN